MAEILTQLIAAFLLGLLGSGHCVGMCGGIATSFGLATSKIDWIKLSLFQLGRILSYSLIGLLLGLLGTNLEDLSPIPLLKWLSAALLLAMALYLSRIWMGLTYLEKLGAKLWRKLQPIISKTLPVRSNFQALALGSLWGYLPCGLVYTALGYALSTASAIGGSMYMAAFGLGTLPAMLAVSSAGAKVKQRLSSPVLRVGAAMLFAAMAFWMVFQLLTTGQGHMHHHH